MRFVRVLAVALTCALLAGALHAADAADTPAADVTAIDAKTACATEFSATKVDGDPNAVVARARNLAGPFTGTITAYGADRMWTATIDRSALVDLRYGGREASVTVRGDAPIEGLEYTPAWASCTFRAGAVPRSGYQARDVARPVLSGGNPQAVERAICPHPYVQPSVIRPFEPTNPGTVGGTVHVAVALDERGVPQFTRILGTPDASLNASAVNAARRSEYQGAIFRCKAVPSGYEFNVEYVR
jgi:hypothetical protein